MMKINNTHAKNSGKKPKPAVFCGPAFIEVKNILALLVMLIYQWKKSYMKLEMSLHPTQPNSSLKCDHYK